VRKTSLIALAVACTAIVFAAVSISARIGLEHSEENAAGSAMAYNPYPPGILPSDLSSETARVQREVELIEDRALARWHALKNPILAGQPPSSRIPELKH
jgi:cytochrome c peroxidase